VNVLLMSATSPESTGYHVAQEARTGGHGLHHITTLPDQLELDDLVSHADAVVLIPLRGNPHEHVLGAARRITRAASASASPPHLVYVSSFVVPYGLSHGLNSPDLWSARQQAERFVAESGVPFTIVRLTWLTHDPAGAHRITLSQLDRVDGMVSRADVATTIVRAVESPLSRGKTFAVFNEPGHVTPQWEHEFAHLHPRSAAGVSA
jgi:uncharacterized protein YbjT (DUF2867 family)